LVPRLQRTDEALRQTGRSKPELRGMRSARQVSRPAQTVHG